MSNKTILQSNNDILSTNNLELQNLIDLASTLPEAGSEKIDMPFEVKLISNESAYTNWGYDWCPNQKAVVIYTYTHNGYTPKFVKCKINTTEYTQSNIMDGFHVLTASNGAGNLYYIQNLRLKPIELTLKFNFDEPSDF